jgi:2,3-bisphosphoglycerate-independent phosphoglycerate mutase
MTLTKTDITEIWEELAWQQDTKIIYLVMDGLGGLPHPETGQTELQAAKTPNFDQLAKQGSCGLLEVVGPGITPGSGPGHLTLFGYNPLKYCVGRGVLSALGIDFDLQEGDIAARVNFATVKKGIVEDRRAGRIATELNEKLCQKIREQVTLNFDGEYFFETVSEHRAVFVLRGEGLGGEIDDTDPQVTGIAPLGIQAKNDASCPTAKLVSNFIQKVKQVLADEDPANMILMRGFEKYKPLPKLVHRFGLRGVCVADYPMYRGVSRLIGMDVVPRPGGLKQRFQALQDCYGKKYDFYFLHVKKSDSAGEDADFDEKVELIEEVDALIPQITDLQPDVLVVTADHSTPATMGSHSWHPVPVLLKAKHARVDPVDRFDEYACARGMLGLRPGTDIMGLALANAGRLQKYGA